MATNPIQKKVRNAALIGALVTLLIMSIVVAFLLMQLDKIKKEQKAIEESYRTVYTLGQDVKSGQIITEDMLMPGTAQIQHIPSNATSTMDTFINYSLTDSEGNKVYSDEIGTFIAKNSKYTEIYRQENNAKKYYTYSTSGQKEEITGINEDDIHEDEFGMYLTREAQSKTRLYKEQTTDKYYVLEVKYNTNTSGTPVREKQYIDILGTPLVAKVNMNMNTVVTLDMLSHGSLVTDDVRKQEYNSISLPIDLVTGDYVDIRVQFPNGQDFIVLSKEMVELPIIEGVESAETIWLNLSEDKILSMSCAIVEAYRINGTRIYATKYTDPGMQEAAVPTYPLSAEIVSLIHSDPNVTDRAEEALRKRYTEALVNIRNTTINQQLQKDENSEKNVYDKMNQSIVKTQEDRKKYLQSLATGGVAF